jgi:hypothetical protein
VGRWPFNPQIAKDLFFLPALLQQANIRFHVVNSLALVASFYVSVDPEELKHDALRIKLLNYRGLRYFSDV